MFEEKVVSDRESNLHCSRLTEACIHTHIHSERYCKLTHTCSTLSSSNWMSITVPPRLHLTILQKWFWLAHQMKEQLWKQEPVWPWRFSLGLYFWHLMALLDSFAKSLNKDSLAKQKALLYVFACILQNTENQTQSWIPSRFFFSDTFGKRIRRMGQKPLLVSEGLQLWV